MNKLNTALLMILCVGNFTLFTLSSHGGTAVYYGTILTTLVPEGVRTPLSIVNLSRSNAHPQQINAAVCRITTRIQKGTLGNAAFINEWFERNTK